MARQQLKPLQTAPSGTYHDPTSFFHQMSQGTHDHRGSMSAGADMISPGSTNAVGPGVMAGGYGGHQLIGASPVVPPPVNAQGGIILGGHGGQGMNVVTTYPPRRKAIRAAQACDACRARKAKCDEGRPSCGFCKESQVACVYREVPPPKQDRTLMQILDRLSRVETLLETINTRGESQSQNSEASPNQAASKVTSPAQQSPVTTASASRSTTMQHPTEILMDEDAQLTIPYQHTTAAHKLLWWPSIRKLVDPELLKHESYVIDEEQNRGTLKIYGRGEECSGGDPNFEEDSDFASSNAESFESMFFIPQGSDWEGERRNGNGIALDEGIIDDHAMDSPDETIMGLGPDGKLRLDRQTVQELLNSFLINIHILHPILDKASITNTAFRFADLFGPSSQESTSTYSSADSARLGMSNNSTGTMPSPQSHRNSISGKRKRSLSTPHPATGPSQPKPIPRTVHSALVLLVLALGAVCLHRRPVPGPLPKANPQAPFPPVFSNATSPFGSPPFSANSPAYRQQPANGGSKAELRNIDVIPGLAYFSEAIAIMGALAGSNDLENVQAGLLAGLYWGQLGRVLDSWKWISWACMGCQIMIRMKLATEKNALRKDLIIRAFWSCLQLESDVLAELDLPPSGISRLEDSMLLPSGITSPPSPYTDIVADDPLMWMYYLAQIALRKLLNRVHTALYVYKQDKTHLDSPRSLKLARELDYQLEQWKSHLPAPLCWKSTDPPSCDINAARLRAKYYGARYIIHRPFVYHALHPGSTANSSPHGHYAESPKAAEDQGGEDRWDITPNELEQNCRKCVEAALRSTTAFHAFSPDDMRPIITNVFGTAHAQFGNLLILQAVYQSSVLRGMIPQQVLADLIPKTIHWLHTLTPISPALRRDAIMLHNAAEKLDFPLPALPTFH